LIYGVNESLLKAFHLISAGFKSSRALGGKNAERKFFINCSRFATKSQLIENFKFTSGKWSSTWRMCCHCIC